MANMISDTHPEVAARQQEMFRRMTPEQRAQMALEMSDSMREVALAGIRMRQPDITAEEQKRELMRIMYGSSPPR